MTSTEQPNEEVPRYVVGLGASAGGLEALEQFFETVPADTAVAFVVIQRLSPDFESHMDALLGRRTKLCVRQAEHGQTIRPNHIYLMPPKVEIRMKEGKLLLSPRPANRTASQPINTFFSSLASDYGKNAIGVVLSGAGSDGAMGVREIHRSGGLVFAQSNDTAFFAGMPASAVATGLVQLVLSPAEIAKSIVQYAAGGMDPASFTTQQLAHNEVAGAEQVFGLLRRTHRELPLAANRRSAGHPLLLSRPRWTASNHLAARPRIDPHLLATYDRLLDRYMPASILVSNDHEVVHVFGGAEKYLRHRGGRTSHHVLDLLDDPLRISVGIGLQQVERTGQSVSYPDLLYESPQGQVRLTVAIEPILEPSGSVEKILIHFSTTSPSPTANSSAVQQPQATQSQVEDVAQQLVQSLEAELQHTQANLQATIEKLESSHEELQESNEELVLLNEELQCTNEALRGVNEELYTVNVQNQRRILESVEANEGMNSLLVTARIGVILLDEELRVRQFTPAIAKVFHLLPQDVGRAVTALTHNLSCPGLMDDLRAVLESQQEREFEVSDTDNKAYLLRMLPYLRDDRAAGVVMALIDIDSMRRSDNELMLGEQAVRESELDYRDTFESAAIGIAHLDAEGRWIRVNNHLCEIVGFNRDELLGMTFHQLTDPEDLENDVSKFGSLVNGEIDGYRLESRYHHRDGHIVWVQLATSRRLHGEGQPWCCIAVIQDISERKEAEIALQKARRMADSANRAKSNFVANMSHELRSPMTAVLGFADMLADEIEVPEQLQKVQTLKRNGDYLLRLLDDILDLSRIESRRSGRDTEPCDFMKLIDEVEVLMNGRAAQVGSRLWFHFPTPLPKTIYTSSTRVRQILVNLIAHALKSPAQGDVNISIRYREEQGDDDQGESFIDFEIADTNIDSSGDVRTLSFTPFSQADPVIAERFAGRGSGLSISKRLVTALGGIIEIASEDDGGSVFVARLPIGEPADLELMTRQARVDDAQALSEVNPLRCLEGKILVADDRRDIWQVTKYFLERCGAEVAVAEDGRQAVDAVQEAAREGQPFDLILLDMQMPVMNGLEAVRELRGAGFSLPIIALTADAMKGERRKCLAAGCNDYLTKPIDVTLLTETVAKHLNEKV